MSDRRRRLLFWLSIILMPIGAVTVVAGAARLSMGDATFVSILNGIVGLFEIAMGVFFLRISRQSGGSE